MMFVPSGPFRGDGVSLAAGSSCILQDRFCRPTFNLLLLAKNDFQTYEVKLSHRGRFLAGVFSLLLLESKSSSFPVTAASVHVHAPPAGVNE